MAGKSKARKKPSTDVFKDRKHASYVMNYRLNVMRVIRAIRNGTVAELDIDRLQNYCQMTFMLLDQTPMCKIKAAWRDTEILSFVHDVSEHEVVLDENKQPQQLPTTDLMTDHLPGRLYDDIDTQVNAEFCMYEILDTVEQAIVVEVAKFGNTSPDQVLSGNRHNTNALDKLANCLEKISPDKRIRITDDDLYEYVLRGYLWHGHKIVLSGDGIGVFCGRLGAREILKVYGENYAKPITSTRRATEDSE
jgi:hypothetical protein